MSFLKNMVKDSIRKGIGDAIGDAVKEVVEPAATQIVNKAASTIEQVAEKEAQKEEAKTSVFGGLEGAFANLEKTVMGYATEVGKNVKMCPGCGQPVSADKKFCPTCGTQLPEETLAQGAVCPSCGKQNDVGTRFCAECGTKLPLAVQEEQQQAQRDAQVWALWDAHLANYPKWDLGGKEPCLECEGEYVRFYVTFNTDFAAQAAIKQYGAVLKENGFTTAGQYPTECHLYKMVNGQCYHVDLEHCFDGDSDCPTIYFNIQEPTGGFNYVKPEEKKMDLDDLKEGFGALKGLFKK